jgi:hypothetical protein
MNVFKKIICHDYTVARAQTQMVRVKSNGVHMIGIMLIANVLSVCGLYIIYFLLNNGRNDIYYILNELHYWEVAGRVGIIMILAIVYLLAFAAFGGRQYFLRTINEFIAMDEQQQEAVSSSGGRYFYGSLLIFFLVAGVLFYLVKVAGL